jgi:hypothetical protein
LDWRVLNQFYILLTYLSKANGEHMYEGIRLWGEGTLKAGNSRSCSLVRSSTNLIDTFVPGKVKVDILAIFAVHERVNICLGKNSVRGSMEECIESLVEIHLVAWVNGAARLGRAG